MTRKIHFLCYLNRSGSTLLAQKLSEFKDIAVGLECRLGKDFFFNFHAENEEQLRYWIDRAYEDEKFRNWNIDRESLYKCLQEEPYPLYINSFLKCALGEKFRNDSARLLIHKGREIFGDLEYYLRLFKDSKVIFIQRDPRATFNSQRKSTDSYTQKPMQTDIVQFAKNYKNTVQKINTYLKRLKLQDRLLVVTYENLLRDEGTELSKILQFLNSSNKKRKEKSKYSKIIPAEQRHLHTNLTKGNLQERIYAWQNELSPDDRCFLSFVLKNEIYLDASSELFKPCVRSKNYLKVISKVLLFYYRTMPKLIAKKILLFLGLRRNW